MATAKHTVGKMAEKARHLKHLLAKSNAFQAREEELVQALYEVRKQRRALEPLCPHPIELVKFVDYVPAGPDVRGNCEICDAMRFLSDYPKRDRKRVAFNISGEQIAGDKLIVARKRRRR